MKAQKTVTRKMSEAMTMAVLMKQGYEIEKVDDYIHAEKESHNLLIRYAGRILSNVSEPESTTVEIKQSSVIELEEKALKLNCTACLSYFVAKHNMKELELCIIPSKIIRETGEAGTEYSYASDNYHYNYAKVDSKLPSGAILRAVWSGDIFE